MEKCLRLYQYHEAPEPYQALSCHAGDEDWILVAPAEVRHGHWPLPLDLVLGEFERSYQDHFGHVDWHELPNGDVVVIFAHA